MIHAIFEKARREKRETESAAYHIHSHFLIRLPSRDETVFIKRQTGDKNRVFADHARRAASLDHHLHEGEFAGYRLELVKFSSWPDLIDALNAGRIDGASVLMQLAMQAKDIGVDLKAVALGHRDGNVIISANDIDEVNDLKGTTFAIPHTHSAHHLLIHELLKNEGLSYDDVNLVEMPPPEMPAALAEGRISGYAVAEPFGAIAVNLGVGKVLAHSESFWPDSYCCVLVLRNAFITENERLTQEFIKHYVAAGKAANEKSDALYEALQKTTWTSTKTSSNYHWNGLRMTT